MSEQQRLKLIPSPLLSWYHASCRELPWRSVIVPYHTWVSEIMLQQTRVDTAISYYNRFLSELPTIADLADVPEQKLLKLWEGLGYYNRARNLQKAAKLIMTDWGGKLPANYDDLQKLPGIGRYTAGAIASIAFSLPVPAVDGNVLRVLSRVLESDRNISRAQTKTHFEQLLTELMENDIEPTELGHFTQALMELGALVCVPNGSPKCEECPLSTSCLAYAHNTTMTLPIKDDKKARSIEQKTILVMRYENKYAIQQRLNKGLLASLWEFPTIDQMLTKPSATEYLSDLGIFIDHIKHLGKAKHIFSHIEWKMTGFLVELSSIPVELNYTWATPEEIETMYPLATALEHYRKFVV